MRTQNPLTTGIKLTAQFICLVDAKNGKKRLKFFIFDSLTKQTESIATNEIFTLETIKEKFFGGKHACAMRNSKWLVTLGRNDWNGCLTVLAFERAEFDIPAWLPPYLEESEQQLPGGKELGYLAPRREKDARFRNSELVRNILAFGLQGKFPHSLYITFFGCSYDKLIDHIEGTFRPGWSWANRGTAWELDHDKAIVDFDLTEWSEICAANHYKNLQALTPAENRAKYSNKKTELEFIFANN